MANNFTTLLFWLPALYYQFQTLACDSFQILFFWITFTIMIRTLAGIVVIVIFVLIVAHILCI